MSVYLGIDIGSSSTKAVLIDEQKTIMKHAYIRSRDIESSLKDVLERIDVRHHTVRGAGVTGSGREYAQQLIEADIVKTEIIAHAVGTLQIMPGVRTIIDIGCEDCKIILLEDGVMRDFNMNTICSSGMGATLENISSRLGIAISDFGDLAIQSDKDLILPMKCGVILSSAVISKKNAGERVENILMAVCNAVARNFLNLTSKGKELREPIAFQGMTAHNKGLVRAMEENLEKDIVIPPQPELMGAFGMAVLTREEMCQNGKQTRFCTERLGLAHRGRMSIEHRAADCIGCGTCSTFLPAYFKRQPDGTSVCITQDVAEEDEQKVKEVAALCPKQIILLAHHYD
jgi:predicted CoA-substrate-specific enzyme activase